MKISCESEVPVFTIHVGISDKNTYQQMVDTGVFAKMIQNVCGGYRVSYSTHMQQGGYVHENGEYIQELSAVVILIGATRETVNSVAADLCCFLNQESVLVETHQSTYYSVSESIDFED